LSAGRIACSLCGMQGIARASSGLRAQHSGMATAKEGEEAADAAVVAVPVMLPWHSLTHSLTAAKEVPEAVNPRLWADHADCCFLGNGNRRLNGCCRCKCIAAGAVALVEHCTHNSTGPPVHSRWDARAWWRPLDQGGGLSGRRGWARPRRRGSRQGRRGARPRPGRGRAACLLQLASPVNATVDLWGGHSSPMHMAGSVIQQQEASTKPQNEGLRNYNQCCGTYDCKCQQHLGSHAARQPRSKAATQQGSHAARRQTATQPRLQAAGQPGITAGLPLAVQEVAVTCACPSRRSNHSSPPQTCQQTR